MEPVAQKLAQFESLVESLEQSGLKVENVFKYGYIVHPKKISDKLNFSENKSIGLTLMAVTHGNEVAGIEVLNQIICLIKDLPELVTYPIGLIMGNPDASMQNKRFLEKDLNRSFDQDHENSKESKRAREIEKILVKTSYLLDFHQTIEPTELPFFIFGYRGHDGFEFAKEIDCTLPIVTHWGKPFSDDGRCSDEYVISKKGTGITLELGQNSYNPYHVAVGFRAAINAIKTCHNKLLGLPWTKSKDTTAKIYSWGEVIPYPGGGKLDPGWFNFRSVKKGEKIGSQSSGDLKASVEGKILFPKYLTSKTTQIPAEICRILKEVSFDELPDKS